jgi:hypothetical protein
MDNFLNYNSFKRHHRARHLSISDLHLAIYPLGRIGVPIWPSHLSRPMWLAIDIAWPIMLFSLTLDVHRVLRQKERLFISRQAIHSRTRMAPFDESRPSGRISEILRQKP